MIKKNLKKLGWLSVGTIAGTIIFPIVLLIIAASVVNASGADVFNGDSGAAIGLIVVSVLFTIIMIGIAISHIVFSSLVLVWKAKNARSSNTALPVAAAALGLVVGILSLLSIILLWAAGTFWFALLIAACAIAECVVAFIAASQITPQPDAQPMMPSQPQPPQV